MDELHIVGASPVFLLAGSVKGITGMGLPTVAVSLLGLWMSPAQAAVLLVLPSLATNVAQCQGPHWRRLLVLLWPAWFGLAGVTVMAPPISDSSGFIDVHRLLGAVLVIYGLFGLWRPMLADGFRQARWISVLVGAATGFVTSVTAVFVFPMVPLLAVV